VGAVQRFAEAMLPSWTPEVDGGSDIIQWGDSTGAIDDRCGCRRDLDEQDRIGGVQLDRGDGIEQLLMVKRARPTQLGWR